MMVGIPTITESRPRPNYGIADQQEVERTDRIKTVGAVEQFNAEMGPLEGDATKPSPGPKNPIGSSREATGRPGDAAPPCFHRRGGGRHTARQAVRLLLLYRW